MNIMLAFLLAGIVLFAPSSTAQQQVAPQCMTDDMREQVRDLMLDAINTAFKSHTAEVFKNWLHDPHDQPERALRGVNAGVSAYTRSRASMLRWSPPLCKEAPP